MFFSCMLGILWAAVAPVSSASARDSETMALNRSLDVLGLMGKPVAGAKWEHVARIERVILNPESGRATFVVLSFVGREGMLAVPWEELAIDELGRARFKRPGRSLDTALRYHPSSAEILAREGAVGPMPGDLPAESSRLRVSAGGENMLEGPVVGRISLPGEKGERRLLAVMEVSERMVRVDLGPEENLQRLGIEVRSGDWIQVRGHADSSAPGSTLEASAFRKGPRWVELLLPSAR